MGPKFLTRGVCACPEKFRIMVVPIGFARCFVNFSTKLRGSRTGQKTRNPHCWRDTVVRTPEHPKRQGQVAGRANQLSPVLCPRVCRCRPSVRRSTVPSPPSHLPLCPRNHRDTRRREVDTPIWTQILPLVSKGGHRSASRGID